MNATRLDGWKQAGGEIGRACVASCRRMLARVKAALLNEAERVLPSQTHLVRLAVNEAEALAWQTAYPHLVFPALAVEKVQAVTAWNHHQRAVRSAARL
jgi:hypothetical protein